MTRELVTPKRTCGPPIAFATGTVEPQPPERLTGRAVAVVGGGAVVQQYRSRPAGSFSAHVERTCLESMRRGRRARWQRANLLHLSEFVTCLLELEGELAGDLDESLVGLPLCVELFLQVGVLRLE